MRSISIVAPDYRIEFPFAREFGEIARIRGERRRASAKSLAQLVEAATFGPPPAIFSASSALPAMMPAAASAAPTKGNALATVRFCAQAKQSRRPPNEVAAGSVPQASQSGFTPSSTARSRPSGFGGPAFVRARARKTTLTRDRDVDVGLVELRRRIAAMRAISVPARVAPPSSMLLIPTMCKPAARAIASALARASATALPYRLRARSVRIRSVQSPRR